MEQLIHLSYSVKPQSPDLPSTDPLPIPAHKMPHTVQYGFAIITLQDEGGCPKLLKGTEVFRRYCPLAYILKNGVG